MILSYRRWIEWIVVLCYLISLYHKISVLPLVLMMCHKYWPWIEWVSSFSSSSFLGLHVLWSLSCWLHSLQELFGHWQFLTQIFESTSPWSSLSGKFASSSAHLSSLNSEPTCVLAGWSYIVLKKKTFNI